jgi:hypothetical protein
MAAADGAAGAAAGSAEGAPAGKPAGLPYSVHTVACLLDNYACAARSNQGCVRV